MTTLTTTPILAAILDTGLVAPVTDDDLIVAFRDAKRAEEAAKRAAADISTELLKRLTETTTVVTDGVAITVTPTTPNRLDETALKAAVGFKVWRTITTAKLDRKKLDAAITKRLVTQTDVDAVTTPGTTHLRLTEKTR
jgi:hypothetical protein